MINEGTTAQELKKYLELPLVIKPVDSSGARDVKVAKTLTDVEAFMEPGLLAEAFVKGSEVSVETFVQDGKPVFTNITEYLHQWRISVVPAQLEAKLQSQILEMNNKIIEKFGVDRGMTHAEFYLTEDGPVFGEIAIRPPGGYYMDLIKKVYSIDSWKLFVNLSCGDNPTDFSPVKNGCAAVYMIHPGPGKVKAIHGVKEIKDKLKGIFEFALRIEVGETILAHENTSNEVGHILFWSHNREQLDLDLKYIESTLLFEIESE
jgi:biotin carboxylase